MLRVAARPTRLRKFSRAIGHLVLGAFLYAVCMPLLFAAAPPKDILQGWRGPFFGWGILMFLMFLSMLAGSWSVGGAFAHTVWLIWKWARPYQAGGK